VLSVRRKASTYTGQHKKDVKVQAFEPTIPMLEWSNIVNALAEQRL
jgi:hypothetical protein